MHVWQLQQAKSKFSALVKLSKFEPQVVSIHGKEEVVVISIEQYNMLIDNKKISLIDLLQASPLTDIEFSVARDKTSFRNIEL